MHECHNIVNQSSCSNNSEAACGVVDLRMSLAADNRRLCGSLYCGGVKATVAASQRCHLQQAELPKCHVEITIAVGHAHQTRLKNTRRSDENRFLVLIITQCLRTDLLFTFFFFAHRGDGGDA